MTSWTPEQDAIFTSAKAPESLLIDALAGTGKTTTLVELARLLPAQPSLALAFNVKIKKELEARLPKSFTVSTMNGLGHGAWGRAIGRRMGVEENKLKKIIDTQLKEWGWKLTQEEWSAFMGLIRLARSTGLVPLNYKGNADRTLCEDTNDWWVDIGEDHYEWKPSGEQIDFLRVMLLESIKQAFGGVIDYDDQIYMSALFGGVFSRFPLVMVDEAQDLSPLNHKQVARSASGRLIVCGDPRQAIYAFRGADSDSMGKLRRLREHWLDLPLSVTFRCPKAVVQRQRAHVPTYRAHDSNEQGTVERFTGRWTYDNVQALIPGNASTAIISRNNAPVIRAAFRLIRNGRAVQVLGRDIGKSLITLSKKLLPLDDTPAEACVRLITEWAEREISLARANEKEHRVAQIEDKSESLLACFDAAGARNAKELRSFIHDLFESSSSKITLSTGHKAKGLEWDCVVHLDPWRVPSKYAKAAADRGNDVPLRQDLNLRYVIETRAKHTLILANLDDFYGEEE